ncbi:MAG TPA: N-acyl homoserine lactonase family protein [Hyphomonas sp.]|nr:N-acyl homoserine lactonase family protein [Hyphomonas sp.]HRJ00531.1 N-acyl homoserine lactonase family protein [Hyphomonas sp.]HRK66822.1 N-acyl homoserine lactonase family protein [Hyphomonas sp.]
MRLALLLSSAASAAVLAACTPAATAPAEPEGAEITEAPALTVNVFDCGTIAISDLDAFSSAGDYAGQAGEFTNTCYLVNHPDGRRLLWDTGLPGILAVAGPTTQAIFTVSLDATITDQLAELGLTPADITYVSVSHSHFDHIGQIDQVQGATWLAHQSELDVIIPPDGSAPQVDPSQAALFQAFGGLQREGFTGEKDVFGDGTAVIFETPGHTPGHTSLQLNMPETGYVLLTGDLYHRAESRPLSRVPRFNFNEEQTLASMAAFEERAQRLGAKVIIQHEKADIAPLGGVIR